MSEYLYNYHDGAYPALSIDEVLKLSSQEWLNLSFFIYQIKKNLMTMDEAKKITEDERYYAVKTHNFYFTNPGRDELVLEKMNEYRRTGQRTDYASTPAYHAEKRQNSPQSHASFSPFQFFNRTSPLNTSSPDEQSARFNDNDSPTQFFDKLHISLQQFFKTPNNVSLQKLKSVCWF